MFVVAHWFQKKSPKSLPKLRMTGLFSIDIPLQKDHRTEYARMHRLVLCAFAREFEVRGCGGVIGGAPSVSQRTTFSNRRLPGRPAERRLTKAPSVHRDRPSAAYCDEVRIDLFRFWSTDGLSRFSRRILSQNQET